MIKILIVALGLSPVFAFAESEGAMKEPSKEQRAQMAEMHTKMADCLKSDKAMVDCHKEMKDNCPMAKEGKCSMMGMHMGDHKGKKMGKGMGKKMKDKEKATE